MKTYKIEYKDKTVKSRGDDALEAVERYGRKQPFGGNTIFGPIHIRLLDADTRGKKWGEFWTPGKDGEKVLISAELIK